jgi:two-component system, NarL family, nitrate/nitrite response regulator NarL
MVASLSARMLNAIVVQSQPRVADALRTVVAYDPGIRVVATVPDVDDPRLAATPADLIVLDGDDLGAGLEQAIATCERAAPLARVCVLSIRSRADDLRRALAARADAYIVKDFTAAQFCSILRSVASGHYYADPRIAGAMLRRRSMRTVVTGELSGRENEIVRLIAAGLSNRDIGNRLSLSEKTVKNHVSHIFTKLKISARSHVAVYAIRSGLVS